jgi:DNA-binding IclR family transcriptional regulator
MKHRDPLCDAIIELLRSKPEGATRTDITGHFDRNKSKAQLDAALATLQSKGMIRTSQRPTDGRAAEVWELVAK